MQALSPDSSFSHEITKQLNSDSQSTVFTDTPNSVKERLIIDSKSGHHSSQLFPWKHAKTISKQIFSGDSTLKEGQKSRLLWKKLQAHKVKTFKAHQAARKLENKLFSDKTHLIFRQFFNSKLTTTTTQFDMFENKQLYTQIESSRKIFRLTPELLENQSQVAPRCVQINFNSASISQDLGKFKTLKVVL